ncbi:hypothetical protein B0H16DRAFT_1469694 [Mycena metata]|uniref:Uncharacterized protein n=1 Tax=Mycena metata TaxID=1033252 RepID=A0AAD7MSS2_9AGAR|nr:hypothetical protein B0H16DRAFT_1469694 [Mycena metata]
MLDWLYVTLILCLIASNLTRLTSILQGLYAYFSRPHEPQLIPYFDESGNAKGYPALFLIPTRTTANLATSARVASSNIHCGGGRAAFGGRGGTFTVPDGFKELISWSGIFRMSAFVHTQMFNSLHFTVAGLQGGISLIREASIQMRKFAAQTADLCGSPKLPFSSLPLWLSLGIRFWQGLVSSFGAPFLSLLFGIVVREPKCTYGAQRCSSMLLAPIYDIPFHAYTKSCYLSCEHSSHFRSIFFIFRAVSYMY